MSHFRNYVHSDQEQKGSKVKSAFSNVAFRITISCTWINKIIMFANLTLNVELKYVQR